MKILRYIVFVLILFIYSNIYAYKFDNTAKIYDYANILKESERIKLKEKVTKYIEKNNIDMIIITVKYYSKDTLKEYMDEYYKNNIGDSKSAILFAIDSKNDDIKIEPYGDAKKTYKNFELKDMTLKVKDELTYNKKINTFINLSNEYASTDSSDLKSNMILQSINWIGIVFISLIVSILIPFIILIKSTKINKSDNLYVDKDSLVINKKSDKFMTTTTKQVSKKEK